MPLFQNNSMKKISLTMRIKSNLISEPNFKLTLTARSSSFTIDYKEKNRLDSQSNGFHKVTKGMPYKTIYFKLRFLRVQTI